MESLSIGGAGGYCSNVTLVLYSSSYGKLEYWRSRRLLVHKSLLFCTAAAMESLSIGGAGGYCSNVTLVLYSSSYGKLEYWRSRRLLVHKSLLFCTAAAMESLSIGEAGSLVLFHYQPIYDQHAVIIISIVGGEVCIVPLLLPAV